MKRDAGVPGEAVRPAAGAGDTLLPAEFVARAACMLGAERDAFLAALADPPAGLRVNTLRLTAERFLAMAPWDLVPLAYPAGGFRVIGGARPGRHPYHAAGLYYLQDPAAMAVAALLDPRPGERVLDLAAAPGGKATHLAALMRGEGVLVANDVHAGRARELAGNLERCGVRNAVVTSESVARLAAHFGAWFDRVLLDAPCSGEAMFHKSEAAREEWSPAAVQGCARRQGELLAEAAGLVRPGGVLVYSTCTFSVEENEEVVARFLEEREDFEVAALEDVPGAAPGRPEWLPTEVQRPELTQALRLWPHRAAGAGHFVVALRRTAGREGAPSRWREPELPKQARGHLDAFVREHLAGDPVGPERLLLAGSELYRVPEGAPPLAGLRTVRPGWWLGTLEKNRFEPGHALALGVEGGAAREVVDLGPEDPALHAYLRGETLQHPGGKGWVLVAVDGFPVGWGKRVGATVKNHYPKALWWRHGAADRNE